MKVSTKSIEYRVAPYGIIATIPAGTRFVPATNLPDGGWFAEPWPNMTEQAQSWQRNYGFHLEDEEL